MERLTEVTDEGIWVKESHGDNALKTLYQCYGAEPLHGYSNCVEGYCGMEKLSEYENAEEDGLLVRLPVPIGTKVYGIYTGAGGKNHVVLKVSFDYGMIPLWGKSVFGTEEAAKEHI